MRVPLFVRDLSEDERRAVRGGLRSMSAFTVRRCQILRKSAEGAGCKTIARDLTVCIGTICSAINAFHREGLSCLEQKTPGGAVRNSALAGATGERLQQIALQSPRNFGQDRSIWTLALLAQVSFEEGLTPSLMSHESIRQALLRMGLRFTKAKAWINSPDPAYERKKGGATG